MPEKATVQDSITSREMRALELNSEYFGVSRLLLMENAGHVIAWEAASRLKPGKSVAVFRLNRRKRRRRFRSCTALNFNGF